MFSVVVLVVVVVVVVGGRGFWDGKVGERVIGV